MILVTESRSSLPHQQGSDPASARDRGTLTTAALALVLSLAACTETLDGGSTRPHGLLPVDERNPIILLNDGAFDNWGTEYAILLAHGGGPPLVGIVVGTSGPWPDIDTNVTGVRDLVAAARESGLGAIPDPISSLGERLERPTSGDLEATQPNRSEGANFIVEASKRLARSYRPLVVAVGGRLTDVADAYLIDPTIVERIVVVASLGSLSSTGAIMGAPNGEMDPWADTIVATRLRYVQVSAFYDQLMDVPSSRLSELPANALGAWIAAKQPGIWSIPEAADQVAVVAVGIPAFATEVQRISPAGPSESGDSKGPTLVETPEASGWLVRQSAGAAATDRFWSILRNPATFAP